MSASSNHDEQHNITRYYNKVLKGLIENFIKEIEKSDLITKPFLIDEMRRKIPTYDCDRCLDTGLVGWERTGQGDKDTEGDPCPECTVSKNAIHGNSTATPV